MTTSAIRWLFALVALAGILGTAHGQPLEPAHRYVKFPIDADYEGILKNRLGMEKQLGPLKDLVRQILADPSKMPVDAKQLEGLGLENDDFKKALKDWVQNDPHLKQSLKDWVSKHADDKQLPDVKKLQEDLKTLLNAQPNDDPGKVADSPPDFGGALPANLDRGEPESMARLAERAMKDIDSTRLGGWLRDSPAWKRAFVDLQTSIHHPDALRWRQWQDRLNLPDAGFGKLGEGTLDGLKQLPKPDLEGWSLPGLREGLLPSISRPMLPDLSGPPLPSAATAVSWIVLVLALLFVGWQLRRWARPTAGNARDRGWQLGPWPVRPEAVATRAELILAFDYLALWTLGLNVQSWNHHAVAQRWREAAPASADIAQVLESLYEQARYTEGAEDLSETQRDEARRSLLRLLEAF